MYTAAPAGSVLMLILRRTLSKSLAAALASSGDVSSAFSASLYASRKFENPTSKLNDKRSISGRACCLAQRILLCRGKNHIENVTIVIRTGGESNGDPRIAEQTPGTPRC